jgi:hypothetical protein
VPGILQEALPGYHGVAWYWREFIPPPNPFPGGRCLLRFHAVDYRAEIWLNDRPVGGHEGGETPFALDVTDLVKIGESNRLAVRVLNPKAEPKRALNSSNVCASSASGTGLPSLNSNGTRISYRRNELIRGGANHREFDSLLGQKTQSLRRHSMKRRLADRRTVPPSLRDHFCGERQFAATGRKPG